MTIIHDATASADPDFDDAYGAQITALTAAYHHTVNTIMTNRYGADWATRGDLPDEAYTTEDVFTRWLSDLLDHIDAAAAPASRTAPS